MPKQDNEPGVVRHLWNVVTVGHSSVLGGGSFALIGALVATIGGFAFVLVTARSLGVAESGRVFVAVALFTVLVHFCKVGSDTGLVRFVPQLRAMGQAQAVPRLVGMAVGGALCAAASVSLLLLALTEVVARLVYQPADVAPAVPMMRTLAIFLPAGSVTLVLLAVTRAYGSVRDFVVVEQLLKPAARPLLVTIVTLAGADALGVLLAWLSPIALGLAVAAIRVRACLLTDAPSSDTREGSVRPYASTPMGYSRGRGFWRFAIPRAFGGGLEILSPWVGVLMVSAFVGSAEASVFTAVIRMAAVGTVVAVAVRLALGPHLSVMFARGDDEEVTRLHLQSTLWTVLISLPPLVTVACFPALVLGAFGAAFTSGAAALTVLALAQGVNVSVGNVQSVVLMAGRSGWNTASSLVGLAMQLAVGFLCIPSLEVLGAASAFAAAIVLTNVLALVQANRGLRVQVCSSSVAAAVALAAGVFTVGAISARWALSESVEALVVATAGSLTLYVVLVTRLRRILALSDSWRGLTTRFVGTGGAQ